MAPVDLASEEGARRWVEAAADLAGGIDILVNNVPVDGGAAVVG